MARLAPYRDSKLAPFWEDASRWARAKHDEKGRDALPVLWRTELDDERDYEAGAREAESVARTLDSIAQAARRFLRGPLKDTPGVVVALCADSHRFEETEHMRYLVGFGSEEAGPVTVWQDERLLEVGGDVGPAVGAFVAVLEQFGVWEHAGGLAVNEWGRQDLVAVSCRMADAERAWARDLRASARHVAARAAALKSLYYDGPADSSAAEPVDAPVAVDDLAKDRVRQMAHALLVQAEAGTLPPFHQQGEEDLKAWCAGVIGKSPTTAWRAMTGAGVAVSGTQGQPAHSLKDRLKALLKVLKDESPELHRRVENVEDVVLGPSGEGS